MTEFTISEVRRDRHAANGELTYIRLTTADGHSLGLSRLDRDPESRWIIDSLWGPPPGQRYPGPPAPGAGSYCYFANGVGSRSTLLKQVTEPGLIARLDDAAERGAPQPEPGPNYNR